MKDIISIERVSLLHPKFRQSAQNFIEDAENTLGIKIRVVQGLRTFAEQDAIYQQGRTTPGHIVTYSPAGTSYHNYGLAIDAVPFNDDGVTLNWNYNFDLLRPFAIKQGMTLGLDFPKKDSDHFENKYGYNWRDLLHKYQDKDFISGTQYVNI
jgi:hypothetical protein